MQLFKGFAIASAPLTTALCIDIRVRDRRRYTNHLGDIAMVLATDGAGRAVEHSNVVSQGVVLLVQAGHDHAVVGLELLEAPGFRLHLMTSQGLQVVHFTFDSAHC